MTDDFKFSVHPDVILKLGNELVQDEFTAILEVAKNAYDAGASRVVVEIEMRQGPGSKGSFFPEATNYVSIRDNGIGMSEEDISNGWLVVAHSRKREPKQLSLAYPGTSRVPLGDKGIGRLGLQRIGDCVDVITRSGASDKTVHIGYRWSDFSRHDRLDRVEVQTKVSTASRVPGTEIIVSDLRDPYLWHGAEGRRRLQVKLSQLISPFPRLTQLPLVVSLNGEPVGLAEVADAVLATAHCRCEFAWSLDAGLVMQIWYSSSYFVQGESEDEDEGATNEQEYTTKERAEHQLRLDGGTGFTAFLQSKTAPGNAYARQGDPPGQGAWTLYRQVTLDPTIFGFSAGDDPGPFTGAIYSLPRARTTEGLPSAFNRVQEFRDFLKLQAGVRVYRNGFAVRPYGIEGDDWLLMAAQREAGRSWYYLKPGSVVGFVSISAADNMQLVEKTDREGFVETATSRAFIGLCRRVVQWINQENTFLRRSLLLYGAELLDLEDQAARQDAAEQPTSSDGSPRPRPSRTKQRLQNARKTAADLRGQAASGSLLQAPSNLTGAAETIESISRLAASLQAEVDVLRADMVKLSELASLGLTVEALSHEIANIAEGLHQRTVAISDRAKKTKGLDPQFRAYFEHARSAVASLRKQLSHIAPSLRYARERRSAFDIKEFTEGVVDYHSERLRQRGVDLIVDAGQRYLVTMSRGRLTQVIDNLVLNSEYWVSKGAADGTLAPGETPSIWVKHDAGLLSVWDNGPGVSDSIRLFEPFQSLKEDGRGLGLFVCKQLLDADKCSIRLLPTLNNQGRPHVFQVDLREAHEEST